MDLAIVGLERSGKTTVFNALTRGSARTGGYGGGLEPNLGTVKVPDERLDRLSGLLKAKKVTHAEIRYIDFPGSGFSKEKGPAAQYLAGLSRADALIHVVRLFSSEVVPHPEGSIDPARDLSILDLELAFSDLAVIDRRLERLEAELRSRKASDREAGEREQAILLRFKASIEAEQPLRSLDLSAEDLKTVSGFGFLTLKPLLVVLNVGDDDGSRLAEVEAEHASLPLAGRSALVALPGKIEEDLSQMSAEEAAEFRAEMGIPEESALDRMIKESYALLGLISFLTVGEPEGRAWTVPEGTPAVKAAGAIHSDIERGFIRAEVTRSDDLLRTGSYAEARRQGLLRTEGKTYIVQDGDVVHVLFNV
ncbi:MAG: redox-regulated ATPase YchF [Dehalococcoidia bacterium]|nr:redox-regulated ATPase YchF [Dehalococcoidia bacterium]